LHARSIAPNFFATRGLTTIRAFALRNNIFSILSFFNFYSKAFILQQKISISNKYRSFELSVSLFPQIYII